MQILKLILLLLLPGMALAIEMPQPAESRTALVIGNADYNKFGVLPNPLNDARAIAASLKHLGFKVLLGENLSREGMLQYISDFGKLLKPGGVGLFYYAGHGMQFQGRNFLIPVNGNNNNEDYADYGIDANQILQTMDDAHDRVNLLVLDACRDDPFKNRFKSRSLSSIGLAPMDAPKGTLIAFSTAPGSIARDGGGGKDSVYTHYLLEKIALPGLPLEEIFKQVRIAVTEATHDKQIPWESSSLTGDFYFVPPDSALKPAPALMAEKPAPEVATVRAQPKIAPSVPDISSALNKALKSASSDKDINREGYEIEMRARNLTIDELPAMTALAERGDVIAQTTLGWAYLLGKGQFDGRGIVRNNNKMLKWTRAAVLNGYPVAQNNLGAIYMDGIGVKIDYQKARQYFKLAADQGYLTGQSNLMQVSLALGKVDAGMVKNFMSTLQNQVNKPLR